MKRQPMAEQWDSFARAVLSEGCPAVQRQEMRRAFYGGAEALRHGVLQVLSAEGEEATAEDLDAMADLEKELSEFAELVKKGRY